jgi:hypothetical protein
VSLCGSLAPCVNSRNSKRYFAVMIFQPNKFAAGKPAPNPLNHLVLHSWSQPPNNSLNPTPLLVVSRVKRQGGGAG